jgi:hypothetical protein
LLIVNSNLVIIISLASLFVGHAAQKSKLHNLQYDEGGNHMAETEEIDKKIKLLFYQQKYCQFEIHWLV